MSKKPKRPCYYCIVHHKRLSLQKVPVGRTPPPHTIYQNADVVLATEAKLELVEQKRAFVSNWKKWVRQHVYLKEKAATAAPAFKSYALSILKEHEDKEPVLDLRVSEVNGGPPEGQA